MVLKSDFDTRLKFSNSIKTGLGNPNEDIHNLFSKYHAKIENFSF